MNVLKLWRHSVCFVMFPALFSTRTFNTKALKCSSWQNDVDLFCWPWDEATCVASSHGLPLKTRLLHRTLRTNLAQVQNNTHASSLSSRYLACSRKRPRSSSRRHYNKVIRAPCCTAPHLLLLLLLLLLIIICGLRRYVPRIKMSFQLHLNWLTVWGWGGGYKTHITELA